MEEDELEVVVSESESVAASEQNGGRQQAANPFYAQPGDPANAAGRISAEDLTVLKGRFPHLADFFGFLPDVSHYRRIAAYRIHQYEIEGRREGQGCGGPPPRQQVRPGLEGLKSSRR